MGAKMMKLLFVQVCLIYVTLAVPASKRPTESQCDILPRTDNYAILDKLCYDCDVIFGGQTHAKCK